MQRTLIWMTLLALLTAGCTLQEARDTPSPATVPAAAPGSGMAAQTNADTSVPQASASGMGGTGLGMESRSPAGPTSTQGSPSVESSPGASPSVEAGTMQAGGPGGVMPQGAPGAMPGMAMASAPLTKTPELDQKIADAEKGKDKKKIAAAYAERGTFRMNDDAAGARVKYRAALEDYRKAQAADPGNAEAAGNKKMIEDIYKSMGRPVPGE
ncbi:MAG: hypothetical protein SFU56_13920 [Capsulimonadales bacterium]|nr:hypothetical protein [Capsulimonadales bacterium]